MGKGDFLFILRGNQFQPEGMLLIGLVNETSAANFFTPFHDIGQP